MKKDNIAENVIKRGKEGVKQNIIEALDEFCDDFADEMWEAAEEIITLRKGNAALKERLEKAVELPKPFIEQDSDGYYRVYSSRINIIRHAKQHGVYDTPEAAEARLKELQGEPR